MPTVRIEPTIFGATQSRGGVPPTTIDARGTPVNFTPTGASQKAYGPALAPVTVVIKTFGGGIYCNVGPDATVTAGAVAEGTGYIPSNGYEIHTLAIGESIAVMSAELT
jgi:hypothetical protein